MKANGEIRVWKVNADKLNPYKSITGAAAHNATYRGKKLGNALTSEMLAGIRDGSFSDLYVGDYIETEDNIYRFMDFDYFLGCVSGVSGGKKRTRARCGYLRKTSDLRRRNCGSQRNWWVSFVL